jgi:hypothetical protein
VPQRFSGQEERPKIPEDMHTAVSRTFRVAQP